MKILYLHQYFNTPGMSGGTRSYEMAKRLVAAGHEVHMITSDRVGGGDGWRTEIVDGIQVHWHSIQYSNHLSNIRRIFAFFRFALVAASRAVNLGGDLVFATSTPLTIAIPAVRASRKLGVPMVFEVRDLWPELPIAVGALRNPILKWVATRLELFAYRNASQIIALSPGMVDGVVNTGYPREQVAMIPNNCNTERFQDQRVDTEKIYQALPQLRRKKVVLYAGTLGVINGVGYLVEIAAAMLDRDPSVVFLIIGDGKEKQEIENSAKKAGVLGQNLWVLPRVAKVDIPAYFSIASMGCSLFVDMPEMWSNSANKFFDTLASARPVMINYSGWQADEIEKSAIGIVIPPRQPQTAAEMLSQYISDDSRLAAAGEAALQLALTKYNTENLFLEFEGILQMRMNTPADSETRYP